MNSLERTCIKLLNRTAALWPDKTFLRLKYRLETGSRLSLKNPKTLNEKIQWLKINNRHDDMTTLVDKVKVKQIVAKLIGEQYVVPTLGVWDKAEDIEFDKLPEQVVIKTNHSGGNTGVVVCKNLKDMDRNQIISRLNKSLDTEVFRYYREWPYKNVEKKVFAEQYLGEDLVDYKFYCFDGKVDCVMLCLYRNTGNPKFYFFDKEWKLRRCNQAGIAAPKDFSVPKPEGIDKMFELAGKLSKGFPFCRVDMYNIDGKIYFGEMTFFPASGFDPNYMPETQMYFGDMIDLSLARNTTSK